MKLADTRLCANTRLCVSAQTIQEASSETVISIRQPKQVLTERVAKRVFNVHLESTTIMLAVANAKSPQPPTRALSGRTRTARKPTILVVEDHDDTREMLHMLLEMWGCRVVEACDGLEAVDVAVRERPQLILMDSRLPFVDGLEATRRIRENGLGSEVKIVALNGSGSPIYHSEALAAGCDDSIVKPFDFNLLRTYLFSSSILSEERCLSQ